MDEAFTELITVAIEWHVATCIQYMYMISNNY